MYMKPILTTLPTTRATSWTLVQQTPHRSVSLLLAFISLVYFLNGFPMPIHLPMAMTSFLDRDVSVASTTSAPPLYSALDAHSAQPLESGQGQWGSSLSKRVTDSSTLRLVCSCDARRDAFNARNNGGVALMINRCCVVARYDNKLGSYGQILSYFRTSFLCWTKRDLCVLPMSAISEDTKTCLSARFIDPMSTWVD
jgi:hypothetical protein